MIKLPTAKTFSKVGETRYLSIRYLSIRYLSDRDEAKLMN